MFNGYGIALGSHPTPFFGVAERAVLAMDGEREDGATLLGSGRRSTVAGAALANAALFHGRAQEDTCGVAHFGAILLPLLTALVERGEGRIEDFLPALVAGYEVGGALEAAYSPLTTAAGLRASPLYGTVAAAAAAARLWRLPEDRTAAALANAASFAGGILQSFGDGTDEWRYQVGMAGRNGLAAATLAASGSVSAAGAFEGAAASCVPLSEPSATSTPSPASWARTGPYSRSPSSPIPSARSTRRRCAPAWRCASSWARRPTPSGRCASTSTHGGRLRRHGQGRPFESVSGTLMSIQFCVATTLLHGAPTIAHMTAFDDAGVLGLIPRIRPLADPALGLLSCRIESDVDGRAEPVVVQMHTDHTEYSYDRAGVSALVRRIGAETGVAPSAYDHIEKFAQALPHADLGDVLAAFGTIQTAR